MLFGPNQQNILQISIFRNSYNLIEQMSMNKASFLIDFKDNQIVGYGYSGKLVLLFTFMLISSIILA